MSAIKLTGAQRAALQPLLSGKASLLGHRAVVRRNGVGRFTVQLKRWTLLPESEEVGETLERALAEGSAFRRAVAEARARGSAITMWTYPDSFDLLRKLKKELYPAGIAVAARPLPEGILISGSPSGTKSAAE